MASDLSIKTLAEWYEQPLGKLLLSIEKQALNQALLELRGLCLLQFGRVTQANWAEVKHIPHKFISVPDKITKSNQEILLTDLVDQPFSDNSFDIVLLPHTLDIYQNMQEILQEALRLVIPEGYLIILGFNPWSWFGLRRIVQKSFLPEQLIPTWHSPKTINYWLNKLDAEIVKQQYCFYRPPINNELSLQRLAYFESIMPFLYSHSGATYLIIARKRIAPLTLIKPRWRWQEILLGKNVAEPTTGTINRG